MQYDFKDKVALVTGGSSGIGKSASIALAEARATVIIASRRKVEGANVEKILKNHNPDSVWIETNIANAESVKNLFSKIESQFDLLDIAFNNASSGGSSNKIHKINFDDWQETMNGTLSSVFHCMKYELKLMMKNNKGSIINNSSVDGLRAFPFDPAYSAAKHGVLGLTKSAALQYADKNIRINAICPGWIDTPPVREMIERGDYPKDRMLQHQPIGRLGTAREVANLVLWLASDLSSFMQGASLPIDGGYTII